MKTYRFSKKPKPWYKRWFSKEKEEWNVDIESPRWPEDVPTDIVVGSMDFSGAEVSYSVNVYEDGTSIIYQNDKPTK